MGGWTLCYQIVLSKLARNQRVTIFFGDSWSFFGVCFHRLNGFAHWYLQFREGYHLWLKLPYMISDISVPTFRKLFVIIVVDTSIPPGKDRWRNSAATPIRKKKKTRPLSNFSPLKLGSGHLLWTQTWRLNLNFNWTSFCWPFCVGAFQTKLASKTCPWNWVFCARSFTGRVDMFTSSKFWQRPIIAEACHDYIQLGREISQ